MFQKELVASASASAEIQSHQTKQYSNEFKTTAATKIQRETLLGPPPMNLQM